MVTKTPVSPSNQQVMEVVFHPKSVAVFGASRDTKKESSSGWVGRLVHFGYKGKLYPINPGASEIMGLKAYPSIKAIPDEVDYAIVNLPREMVPGVVQDCVEKGVKVVHVYSAGFAETGTEEGKKLQDQVKKAITGSNTRLIGPNCIGVYCPSGGLTFSMDSSKEAGEIAFFTQTGTGGRQLVSRANARGLRFSKVVSYGNALDLGVEDFVEYSATDNETKVILLYVEGLKDGSRFFEAIRRATKVKPVIVLAAGLTESGAGAAASHTASLAGNQQVWRAFFEQTGAIQVEDFDEAIEQLVASLKIPKLTGNKVGLVGRGGGLGVITSDMCERNGLKVPRFTQEIQKILATLTAADSGSTITNPAEIGFGREGVSKTYAEGLRVVASDPQIDFVLTFLYPEMYVVEFGITNWVDGLVNAFLEVNKTMPKPMVVAFVQGQNADVFKDIGLAGEHLLRGGIACFPTIQAATKAVAKLVNYYRFIEANYE